MPKTLKELKKNTSYINPKTLYYDSIELDKEINKYIHTWRATAWEYSNQVQKLLDVISDLRNLIDKRDD